MDCVEAGKKALVMTRVCFNPYWGYLAKHFFLLIDYTSYKVDRSII